MSVTTEKQRKGVSLQIKDWHSWINAMPPLPDDLHVRGMVLVGNPGIQAQLRHKNPQPISGTELYLDLYLVQQPGMWPQVETWVQALYDETLVVGKPYPKQVDVFYEEEVITKMEVKITK